MANDFYNVTGTPVTGSFGASAAVRNEFTLVQAAFNKLPTLTGAAGTAVVVNSTGTGLTNTVGTFALAGNFATTNGGNTITSGTGVVTIGASKTITVSNTLTFTGTDGSTVNFGAGGTVLYSGGSYVASIAGTANEITASAATGAVTLSLPAALTFTGKTITGGTYSGATINAASNTISNISLSMFAANVADTDATLAANSNARVATQAAIKSYVDNAITGLTWKAAARAATTAGLPAYTYNNGASGVGATITGNSNGALAAQDGISLTAGQRLLVKNETAGNAPYNGLYTVTQVGDASHPYILTRATDADTGAEIWGAAFFVEAGGTTNGSTQWANSNSSQPTMGTTAISFGQLAGAGTYSATGGITLTGNQFSLDTTVIAITSGKKLTVSNTVTLSGTDGSTITFGAGGTVLYSGGALGTPSSGTLTNCTGLPLSTGVTGSLSPSNGGKPTNRYTNFTNTTTHSTASATKVMGGFGSSWAITPSTTGRVRVKISGTWTNSQNLNLNFYYGTGTAPVTSAAVTGTAGLSSDYILSSSVAILCAFSVEFEITGLTLSTAYWFDIGLSSSSGTGNCKPCSVIIEEF